ncbi:hypothetical protein K443DRAFT_418566 [Laccaria amethystina LaAM-08-1]|uniref:Uncharacterized protein n=1 Tax=Laccaria amethystina LaAM-08-1 TaxID=1095629 RepID=A0A0C9WIG6_9AGAR|nr:hypothetical protein K443DRAFT_418566 [Laccaria amethystina LaAM-08-1]
MFSTPSTPHAPDLPPLALAPSGQTQRSSGLANRDNPQGFGCLRDEDVDGRDHTSHKLTMSTKMKMDGVGSDLNVNGSGGLRAEADDRICQGAGGNLESWRGPAGPDNWARTAREPKVMLYYGHAYISFASAGPSTRTLISTSLLESQPAVPQSNVVTSATSHVQSSHPN